MKQERPSANVKSEKVVQEQQEMKSRTTAEVRQQPPKVKSPSKDIEKQQAPKPPPPKPPPPKPKPGDPGGGVEPQQEPKPH